MKHIHILGICGYATGGLALMAKKMGYLVTGSDEDAYPPMSDLLTQRGIAWVNRHSGENLKRWGQPDLVIQGNQIRAGNPELLAAGSQRLKIISDSEFFYDLTKDRRRIVVTGSHGKTTTSALIAWILAAAGRRPGFRLGSVVKNFKEAVRLGAGPEFVFEGDEYTTTFADARPKFFHFHPQIAVLNNVEWDHPDIFKTRVAYEKIFKKYLIEELGTSATLVANAEDVVVQRLLSLSRAKITTFGFKKGDVRAEGIVHGKKSTQFQVTNKNKFLGSFETFLAGDHNVRNCLAAIGLALNLKIDVPTMARALKTFKGTSRRFEVLGEVRSVTVIDDYAHHPTKARETIAAAKKRFPRSRLLVIYVPHTYSRTKALLPEHARAFNQADWVVITEIEPARERHLVALINSQELVEAIRPHQPNVFFLKESAEIINFVKSKVKKGDVVLCMSVRGFDNLAQNLAAALKYGKSKV